MRPFLLAVMLSAALHAMVVAWVATRPPAPHTPAAGIAASVDIEVVEPAPTTARAPDTPPGSPGVASLPGAVAAAVWGPASAIAAAHAPVAPAVPVASVERSARSPAQPAQPEPPAAPSSGPAHSMMAMRRAPPPRLALPTGRWDDLDHPPAGSDAALDRTTGELHDSGGGSHDSDQGVFVASIAPDGTAQFTDRPSIQPHIILPSPRSLGLALGHWLEDSDDKFRTAADTSMAKQIQVSPGAPTEPVDPVASQPADRATTVVIPVIGGPLDVNDWLLRRHGADPYAARKLALLDATRDERAQIGSQHRAAQLHDAATLMQKNLDALWAGHRDARARKQALFELWDECAETGDPALVEAGAAARRMVIGFIRGHFPAGSRDGFTPAELAELARTKHSAAAFRPYD